MVVWPLHGAANERRIVQEKGTGTKRNEKISPVDLGTASDRPVTTTDPDPPVCVWTRYIRTALLHQPGPTLRTAGGMTTAGTASDDGFAPIPGCPFVSHLNGFLHMTRSVETNLVDAQLPGAARLRLTLHTCTPAD
jgi:hypothetical protein